MSPISRSLPCHVVLVCLSGVVPAMAAEAMDTPRAMHIPAGSLANALDKLNDQSGLQIMYEPNLASGVTVPAVDGTLTARDALTKVLATTKLRAEHVNDHTVVIRLAQQTDAPQKKRTNPEASRSREPALAQDSDALQEVLVTAQKREENIHSVPVPVTVVDSNALAQKGQVLLRDYYQTVPGLNMKPNIEGNTNLIIRGISASDFGNPTVGVLIDDVPFGGSTGQQGNQVPDIDPADLARIEVLRGPQGTLYGVNSMGGIVKFVTTDPSTDAYSGRLEGALNTVKNGSDGGYNARGQANVPLSETFAVRVSGFVRQDPGYIDNPVLNRKDVNRADASGGRMSALWKPSDTVSLKLSALYQLTQADALSESIRREGLGDLEQNYLPGIGKEARRVQAYSATLNVKMGEASLTSVTGYNKTHYSGSLDATELFGPLTLDAFGVEGTPFADVWDGDKVSQELRLNMPLAERLDLLLGGFYTDESSHGVEAELAEDPANGAILGVLGQSTMPSSYREYAAFSDLTYRFTDQFDVQLGGRQSHFVIYTDPVTTEGPLYGGTSTSPGARAKEDAFTYLATARYRPNEDLTAYLRLASGYRPGGPNPSCDIVGFQCEYSPDKTSSYELGLKGNFFDRRLLIDASLYYVDWKDIQIQLTSPAPFFQSYESNGSGAKSEGVELAASLRPGYGLTIDSWVSFNNAVLTQSFPADSGVSGLPGDRLPNSSRWSGNLSLREEFPMWNRTMGFVGASAAFVGDRQNAFAAPGERQTLPSYTKLDLLAGIKYDSWTLNAYINNLTDERGILNRGIGNNLFPDAYVYIVPRTAGVSVIRTF